MAEYTTSPTAYEGYMTSRERCVHWVQKQSSDQDGFYSPSVPPTKLEGFIPSSPPSDAGSSYSLPPKMVLRYNDGRPDMPIPHANLHSRRHVPDARGPPHGHPRHPGHQRSHTPTSTHPHPSSPIPVHPPHHSSRGHPRHSGPLGADSGSPEEIRILPSHAPTFNGQPPRTTTTSSHPQRTHHSRSKSLPRVTTDQFPEDGTYHAPNVPLGSGPIPQSPPTSRHHRGTPSHNVNPPIGPEPWYGVHSSSGSTNHSRGRKVPPPVVYAPSHQTRKPHYAPPAILYHQPPRGPNGMVYSHSAPVPIQGGPYPAPLPPNEYEERGRRERTRSLTQGRVHKIPRSDGGEVSDGESAGSGSTYYVLPAAGQKVQAIAPSPNQSVHTSTTTTKASGLSPRKPFFQRLFSFAKIGSSTGGSTPGPRRKLQRRHSTGESGRPDAMRHPAVGGEYVN